MLRIIDLNKINKRDNFLDLLVCPCRDDEREEERQKKTIEGRFFIYLFSLIIFGFPLIFILQLYLIFFYQN